MEFGVIKIASVMYIYGERNFVKKSSQLWRMFYHLVESTDQS